MSSKQVEKSNRLLQTIKSRRITIIVFAAVLIIVAFISPVFFTPNNLLSVLRQASITGIVAVGMTLIILTGGIDLSVGYNLSLCGIIFAIVMTAGLPIWVAILAAMGWGLLSGFINGFGVTFLGVQPFIMTLATMSIWQGIALVLSKGTPVIFNTVDSPFLKSIGNGNIFGIPGPLVVFIIVAIVMILVLRYTRFGRFIYGVGGNREAARLSGVRTTLIIIMTYVITGFLTSIASIVQVSQFLTGDVSYGTYVMMDSIAAVVIGGTSMAGGRGSVGGTVFGAILLSVVSNIMNLTGVSAFYQNIILGLIIILAVLATSKNLIENFKKQLASM